MFRGCILAVRENFVGTHLLTGPLTGLDFGRRRGRNRPNGSKAYVFFLLVAVERNRTARILLEAGIDFLLGRRSGAEYARNDVFLDGFEDFDIRDVDHLQRFAIEGWRL